MRAALVMLVCLAACETRYGSYLVVDGAPRGITFDRVELFVGHGDATAIPRTPLSAAESGKRLAREFAATDEHVLDAPRQAVEFYLPEGSEQVGTYVAVVAFKGDTAVGIGELNGYEIATDTIYQYVIELEPWSPAAERWGDPTGPACLRWTRERDGVPLTVAVVRPDDIDCDGIVMDCTELEFCTADMPCSAQMGPCFSDDGGGGCTIGMCVDGGGCVADTCTIPGACDPACTGIADRHERLTCALDVALDHIELTLPVSQEGVPCITVLTFVPPGPGNFDCHLPLIEAPFDGAFAGVSFKIFEAPRPPAGPTPCELKLVIDSSGPFIEAHHLLLSIAAAQDATTPPGPLTRWSFLIGVEPGPPELCRFETVVTGMGDVMTCHP